MDITMKAAKARLNRLFASDSFVKTEHPWFCFSGFVLPYKSTFGEYFFLSPG